MSQINVINQFIKLCSTQKQLGRSVNKYIYIYVYLCAYKKLTINWVITAAKYRQQGNQAAQTQQPRETSLFYINVCVYVFVYIWRVIVFKAKQSLMAATRSQTALASSALRPHESVIYISLLAGIKYMHVYLRTWVLFCCYTCVYWISIIM